MKVQVDSRGNGWIFIIELTILVFLVSQHGLEPVVIKAVVLVNLQVFVIGKAGVDDIFHGDDSSKSNT